MCRINEKMDKWRCNSFGPCPDKIAKSIENITYEPLPEVKSLDECTLQCTQKADSLGQKGCCEFRVAEEGSCKWTAANGHPYLAHEYRYEWGKENNGIKRFGSSKNTKAVLCTSGKRISYNPYHNTLTRICYTNSLDFFIILNNDWTLYRSEMQ